MELLATIAALLVAGGDGAAGHVEKLAANFGRTDKLTYSAKAVASTKDDPTDSEVVTYRVWSEGDKQKTVIDATSKSMRNGKPVTSASRSENIQSLTDDMCVFIDPNTSKVLGLQAAVKPKHSVSAVQYRGGGFEFFSHGRTILNGDQTLPELLAASNVGSQPVSLGNVQALLLTGTGKWGTVRLWLDPARGHAPLKYVQEKSGGDLVEPAEPLKNRRVSWRDPKSAAATSHTQTCDVKDIRRVGDKWFVTSYVYETAIAFSDGTVRTRSQAVTISDIKVVDRWAADPFVVTARIPDGMAVAVEDDKPFEYEWRGGKVVKAVDQTIVATAGSHAFVPPAPGRWWPWAAGTAVVGGMLGLAAWRLRRARRSA